MSPQRHFLSMIYELGETALHSEDNLLFWHGKLIRKAYDARKAWQGNQVDVLSSSKPQIVSRLRLSIFFLARIRMAFNTIVRAIQTLSGLDCLTFTPVSILAGGPRKDQSNRNRLPKHIPSSQGHIWNLNQAFEAIDVKVSENNVSRILGRRTSVREAATRFNACQHEERAVHAEMQLLLYACSRPYDSFFDYMGCSKRSCFLCWNVLHNYGFFRTCGCHGKLYHRWTMPETECATPEKLEMLRSSIMKLTTTLGSLLSQTPIAIQHVRESTVGSSSITPTPFHYVQNLHSATRIAQHLERSRLLSNGHRVGSEHEQISSYCRVPPASISEEKSPTSPSRSQRGPSCTNDMAGSGASSNEITGECGSCERETDRHCSSCGRDWFCSAHCQQDMTIKHRFWCAGNSLTTAEYLYDAVLRDEIPDDPQTIQDYGFARCTTWNQKSHLLGLYKGLFYPLNIKSGDLDRWRRDGVLVDKIIETFHKIPREEDRGGYFPWFLNHKELLSGEKIAPAALLVRPTAVDKSLAPRSFKTPESHAEYPQTPAERCALVFFRVCSEASHPPPGLLIEGFDLWYELGFVVCKNQHEEGRLGSLYHKLLFGNKFWLDYHRSLGSEYAGPTQRATCGFEEFWKAWESGMLIQLMDRYGHIQERQEFAELDSFLASPLGSPRLSIWRLKHWLEDEVNCNSPEAVKAARAYGFRDDLTTRQDLVLKEIYRNLLGRGRAMDLDHALHQGRIYEYARMHLGEIEADLEQILRACTSDSVDG